MDTTIWVHVDQEHQDTTSTDDDAMSIIQEESRFDTEEHVQLENREVGALNIEDAIPLNSTELPETIEPPPISTTLGSAEYFSTGKRFWG